MLFNFFHIFIFTLKYIYQYMELLRVKNILMNTNVFKIIIKVSIIPKRLYIVKKKLGTLNITEAVQGLHHPRKGY